MRIAISTPVYPLPGDLTRGRFLYEIARCLSELATVEVFFHTGRYPKPRWLRPRSFVATDVTEDLSTPETKVASFTYPAVPMLTRAINGYVSGRALLNRLARFRPDVVLGYWIYPEGFGAWRCARQLGVPCVLGGLGTDIRLSSGVSAWLSGHALRGADQLIMVSEEMRALVVRRFGVDPVRVHTIINGVDPRTFHERDQFAMRHKLGLPADARVILYVGRFVAAKGIRELIEAFAELSRQDARLRLVMIGDGVMREEVHARVAALQYRDRVTLPGPMQPAAIAEWMGAADLLCLPSYSEGYPNVVVEALASGRPVVATNVGGIPELVNADNGSLVPARDAVALQRGLLSVLERSWSQRGISSSWSRSWTEVARLTLAVCELAHSASVRRAAA
jgi:teichuronic acid biosynthesis glycosyltransferase TuaC